MRIGIAGIGFMGWIHWLAWKRVPGVEVAAICSRDPLRRGGDWTGIQGNFGPPGEQVDLSGVTAFDNLNGLFADSSLDLVDLCLPPGMHARATIAALGQGRHVLCEKPMALTLAECDQMMAAAEASDRRLLVAHVLPFFPEYAAVRELVDTGRYGRLLGGDFRRTISNPEWIDGFFDPRIVGGPLLDLHVHDAHFVRSLFGMPETVTGSGRLHNGLVEYFSSLFRYPNDEFTVACNGGVINQQGRPFTHAFEIHFERATVQFEFAACADENELMPLKILEADGGVVRPDTGDGDPVNAFVDELQDVANAISGPAGDSGILDGMLARDAIRMCEATADSIDRSAPVALY